MISFENIEEYTTSKKIIQIHRCIGVSPLLCVPLAIGKDILLIQYLHDFHLEGYKVIRLKDISKVVRDSGDEFVEGIFKKEGIYEQIRMPNIKMQDNMIDMLKEIQKKNINFILDCDETNNETMYIGRILEISEKLLFETFDTLGKWEEDLLEINYDDITALSYNEYNEVYSKYLI